jgi:capsular exopolysaccharide synthesis family protein
MTNGMGLSNYLTGEVELDEVIKPIADRDNYFIITSGPIPPNPTELLSGPRLEKLITELRHQFDYVIIDAPPVGLVTDAQIIAPFSDATMFMVRHDVTPKNSMKMIETLYQEKRFNKLNIILNGVGDGEDQYYSYGYSGKGYYN